MTYSPRVARIASFPRPGIFVCAALALVVPVSVQARGTAQGEARVAECIRQTAGGHPWLERTLWGLRDQEGGWLGAQIRNTNGSHDLGPLQINTWWVPKIAALVGRSQGDVRVWLTSDPCFNAGAARWIFLSALQATGDFWTAVGVYHSPTKWRQRRYALSVAHHLKRRFGPEVFNASNAVLPKATIGAEAGNAKRGAAETGKSGDLDARTTGKPSVTEHGFGTVQGPPG